MRFVGIERCLRWDVCEEKSGSVDLKEPNCAQIVPVKVKYFQMFPNETKS